MRSKSRTYQKGAHGTIRRHKAPHPELVQEKERSHPVFVSRNNKAKTHMRKAYGFRYYDR